MKTLASILAVLSVCWFISPSANADAVATLRGIVQDANGQPLPGAEVRIIGKDTNSVGKVHTDASGHYSYPGLETGTYNVTLVVDGTTRASINNVRTQLGEVQTLNFALQKGAAARPFAKGRHYVWIPSTTGTHLGRWVETTDDAASISTGMQERLANQGNNTVKEMIDQHPPTMGHH
jgi:Carboxypeptidase regulatory-like domain